MLRKQLDLHREDLVILCHPMEPVFGRGFDIEYLHKCCTHTLELCIVFSATEKEVNYMKYCTKCGYQEEP